MAVSISYNGEQIGTGPSLPAEGYRVDGNRIATLRFEFFVLSHPLITSMPQEALEKWLAGNLPFTLKDDEHGVWVDCFFLRSKGAFTFDDPKAWVLLDQPTFVYSEPVGYLPMP